MDLNWSTWLLEIINFLVLAWILKRFLYQPVLDVIARRRAGIENQLAEARHLHDEADRLKAEYENRLLAWDRERQRAREALAQELQGERARRLEALHADLAQERDKDRTAAARRRTEARRAIEHQALQQSARFAARLLEQASGPELEERLTELVLDGLTGLPDDRLAALRTQWGEPPEAIIVASAFALPEVRKAQLEKILTAVTELAVPVRYEQHPDLLAGLRISIGAWVLRANLQDELKGFAEFAYAVR